MLEVQVIDRSQKLKESSSSSQSFSGARLVCVDGLSGVGLVRFQEFHK